MILAAAQLTLRLHRFVIVAAGLAVVLLAVLAIWYAARIDTFPGADACRALITSNTFDEGARDRCRPFFAMIEEAGRVVGVMAYLPVVAGVFLGVPIVAQELDRGTTPLVWSLEPSRWRWLAQRALPVAGLAALLGLVGGAAADHLEPRILAGVDPWASFHDYGLRGPLVAGRLILVLGSGVLVGALLGRTLPAVLLSLVAASVLVGAMAGTHLALQRAEATVIETPNGQVDPAANLIEGGARLATGEDLTYEQLMARYPNPGELERAQAAAAWIMWVTPGDRYPIVAGREALATGGLGLALMALAVPVVTRRRPDPGRIRLPLRAPGLPRRAVPAADGPPGRFTAARLALWPHRSEFAAGVVLGIVASLAAGILLSAFSGLSAPAHCIADRFLVPVPPECATTEQYLTLVYDWGGRLFASMAVLPWLVGALIGVVVVGREIEQRTATLAWSLSPDRRRWLLGRTVVAAVVVGLLLAVPSVVASETERMVYPWAQPETSFHDYGLRGHLVVARGVAAFAIALLVGAVIGRVLPSLLLAGVGCIGLALVLGVLLPFGQPAETLPEPDYSAPGPQPLYQHSIPGERLREVELRESVFLAGVTLALVVATVAVVDRRSPA